MKNTLYQHQLSDGTDGLSPAPIGVAPSDHDAEPSTVLTSAPLMRWLVADGLLSLLAIAGGYLLVTRYLSIETASSLLALHMPAEGLHPLLFWLRVSVSLLPALLVLGVAGSCCCGGTLCSGVLLWRGLCDGAALGTVGLVGTGAIPLLTRLVTLLVLRLALSLWSRTAAGRISDPTLQHAPNRRGLSPLMLRHLACLLSAAALGAALCGLYTLLLYLLLIG